MTATRAGSNRSRAILWAVVGGWFMAVACGGGDQDDGRTGSGGTTVSSGGDSFGVGGSTGGRSSGGVGTGGQATGGFGTGGVATGGANSGGIGGGSACVPFHYPGSSCSSCHGAACTCETQYSTCLMRVCASPDTPIATPSGTRPMGSLVVGDLVFSVDGGEVVAVPVRQVRRGRAGLGHKVVRVVLATGSVLEVSAPHPTADGRTFGDLRTGGLLGGLRMLDVQVVPYRYEFTYDILPASDSGTYFAGGVLVGSTLAPFPDMEIWGAAAALMPSASCEERCRTRCAFDSW
jgi:hypothetical protein